MPPDEEGPEADAVRKLARKYALQNAVLHDGASEVGPVMAKVLWERPEWRPHAKAIIGPVKESVDQVNSMGSAEQLSELESIDPSLVERGPQERERDLPDLEGTEDGVVMRFAPGPSGPLHVGHSRAAVVNDEYVKRYGGRYILRLEDTDPARVLPEAYSMIQEDMEWLGCSVTEMHEQTDRFDMYYEHAVRLLEMGAAYTCLCPPEPWRELKHQMKPCPHREEASETQFERWEGMLDGTYPPEGATVVIKTDLADPNPALRDWVALRISDEPHPKTGTRFRVYPLYNFSVALDDHLMGMTHVLRGKDHLNNTLRQKWIYKYLGWPEPHFHHYGFVTIEDTVLKTSHILESLTRGEYSGWDDPRLGTLRALARRGIDPGGLRRYWVEASIRPIEMHFSWKTLFAHDREIQEGRTPRLFFVTDPEELVLEAPQELVGHAPVHPDRPEMGIRRTALPKEGDTSRAVVATGDLEAIEASGRFRLKDLGNFEMRGNRTAEWIGDDLAILKEGVPIVHWAPPDGVPTVVHHPDGRVERGVCEPAAAERDGQFVQFERFGFARLEIVSDPLGIEAYFAYR
jgi:glutamyl-tRNA synthetase